MCPECDRPLLAEALNDGWCPECGEKVPEFIRKQARHTPQPRPPATKPSGTKETGWFPVILLLVGGGTFGLLFGMAKHEELTGPWVIILDLIYMALLVGWWIELLRKRKSRASIVDPKDEDLA